MRIRAIRGKEFPSEVWGDGTAIRVFTYVDDTSTTLSTSLVDGIYTLMQSDLEGPVHLGSDERVTVAELSMGAEAQGSKGAQEWRSKGDFTLAPLHPCTPAQRGGRRGTP